MRKITEKENMRCQVLVYKYIYVEAKSIAEAEDKAKQIFLANKQDLTTDDLRADVESINGYD